MLLAAKQPELFLFLLAASNFISWDARRLGVLVSVIRDELNRRGSPANAERWGLIEANLRKKIDVTQSTEPFISHLPSLPGRRDPIFLAWGFEYPGIVREPEKYLRKAV